MLHWCTFAPVLSARRCSVNVALDSRMSSPLTGLPWFDDIIWIFASRLVSYPASLKRASPSTGLVDFHVISTPI